MTSTEDAPEAGTPEPEDDKSSSRTRSIIEWVVVIAGALVVALLIKAFLIQAFYIPSESMVPTLEVGDRVLVNKLSYKLHDVNRGDIVVFERPEGETNQDVQGSDQARGRPAGRRDRHRGQRRVRRRRGAARGLPAGRDDHRAGKPYLRTRQSMRGAGGFHLGDGGQPRHSFDSRYFGPIEEDTIVGRAFLRIWPLSSFGFM